MALVLKKLFTSYIWLMEEVADPRVDGYYLMSSPFQPAIISLIYLYIVKSLLPKFMKNRPPYNLDRILIIYNSFQVIVNAYIVYYGSLELTKLDWRCSPVDYTDTPHNRFVLVIIYLYFIVKITDLLDTIFFVLRKKDKQVTFLHVYHHFGMITVGWVGTRFLGGGHSIYMGVINSFVHTVMYFYYLLSIWKSEYKNSIWWKKHITQLQLLQFLAFIIIYGNVFLTKDCGYPKFPTYIFIPQNLFMLILFGDFYWKTYVRSKKTQNTPKNS